MKEAVAKMLYDEAVTSLKKYCSENTDLIPEILTDDYPARVVFFPDPQIPLYAQQKIASEPEEKGEDEDHGGRLVVTCDVGVAVDSTLHFVLAAATLKKLIKKAETVCDIYYRAYRESEGTI